MKKHIKNKLRSALTGKIINGRDVILTTEAIEYVKKMGLIVHKPIFLNKIINQLENKPMENKPLEKIALIFLSILFLPLVSAQPAIFTMDFTLWENRIVLMLVFAMAGLLYYKENSMFAGVLVFIASLMMVFNDINIIVSMFVMIIGIVLIGGKKE